ncbi:MAG: T9SS type A sorting domain-containing protein [Candidatus Nomurabacteria bacterium]|nr:T9SS type A sorting domain-containing protein [Candidatus Nomurabacteria bacterium]
MRPLPVLPITSSGSTTFCNGGSTTLQTTPNLQNYNWQGAWGQGNTAVVSWNGNVTVIATDSFGCTGQSQPVTITVLNTSVTPIISQVGCNTFSNVAPDSTTTLSWTLYGTSAVLGTTQLFQPPHYGMYVCTATNINGCANASVPFAFTNLIIPPVLNTTGMTEGCQGQNINLVVLNAASYSSLIWSNGANTSNIVVNNSGLFSVTGYNNGCQQTSVVDTVIFHPNPTATISGNSQFCEGSTDTLSVSAGASTYCWNTNQNTASISVTNSGTYSVTTTNTFGCTGSASITVTANPLPIPVIAVNGCVVYITNSQPGDTQEWYINGILVSGSGDYISTGDIGMYQVFVTNSSGCSNGSNSIFINCTAGIEEAILNNASIYQTDHEITIKFTENKDHTINIFDVLGKKVFEKTAHGTMVIQTENFNSGMYFIQGLKRILIK